MAYPSDLDSFSNPVGTNTLGTPDHALLHRQVGSAVVALEGKVGVASGSPTLNAILVGSGNGTSNWGTVANALSLGTPAITAGTITNGTINAPVIGTPAITGGTANALTLGTPVIGTVSVPGTVTALGFSAAIAPGVGTLTDVAGGTLTVNAQLGNVFYSAQGTAAGNRTIAAPLNPTGYQQLTYAFKTSGSANSTAVWNPVFRYSQDSGTPAFGTGVGWNYFNWRFNFIDTKWDFLGQSKNLV